jgi:hypothetical protein
MSRTPADEQEIEKLAADLGPLLIERPSRASRRYRLERVGDRLMLVRDDIDRAFEFALQEACGCEIESDEKDGKFLD